MTKSIILTVLFLLHYLVMVVNNSCQDDYIHSTFSFQVALIVTASSPVWLRVLTERVITASDLL